MLRKSVMLKKMLSFSLAISLLVSIFSFQPIIVNAALTPTLGHNDTSDKTAGLDNLAWNKTVVAAYKNNSTQALSSVSAKAAGSSTWLSGAAAAVFMTDGSTATTTADPPSVYIAGAAPYNPWDFILDLGSSQTFSAVWFSLKVATSVTFNIKVSDAATMPDPITGTWTTAWSGTCLNNTHTDFSNAATGRWVFFEATSIPAGTGQNKYGVTELEIYNIPVAQPQVTTVTATMADNILKAGASKEFSFVVKDATNNPMTIADSAISCTTNVTGVTAGKSNGKYYVNVASDFVGSQDVTVSINVTDVNYGNAVTSGTLTVFAFGGSNYNLARLGTVEVQNGLIAYSWDKKAAYAIDGKMTTSVQTYENKPYYCIVHLLKLSTVSQIKLYFDAGAPIGDGYSVDVTSDYVTWTTVASNLAGGSLNLNRVIDITPANIIAVRLNGVPRAATGSWSFPIKEFEVYGAYVDENAANNTSYIGTNLALNKTCTSTVDPANVWFGTNNPGAWCTDGITLSSSFGNGSKKIWDLIVNLGKVSLINECRVMYENKISTGYEIWYSAAETQPTSDSDWSKISVTGPSNEGNSAVFFTPVYAKFVRIHHSGVYGITPDAEGIYASGTMFAIKEFQVMVIPAVQPIRNLLNGDANGDGKLTISDLLEIKKHILTILTLSGDRLASANINGSGDVSVEDLALMKMHLLKQQVITN